MTSVTLPLPRPGDGDDLYDDPDEGLYEFLERHESGPCPACPVELHVAELLQ